MSEHKRNEQFIDPISGQLGKANSGGEQELTDEEIEQVAGGIHQQPEENGISDVLKKIQAFFDPDSWECPHCGTDNAGNKYHCSECKRERY